jgi:hypothetical protein
MSSDSMELECKNTNSNRDVRINLTALRFSSAAASHFVAHSSFIVCLCVLLAGENSISVDL